MSLSRLAIATIALMGMLPAAAIAKPVVKVVIAPPPVVVTTPHVVVAPAPVVVRPACPGPDYVWVEGTWRRDAYGRRIFVSGYWAPRPVPVVVRPAHRVVVHRY